MFGERYFATRERLSDVMRGISGLAEETKTDLGDPATLAELAKGIRKPYLFVVCGEINAGKSTLINALFGHDLCRVSNLPETQRVIYYQHGSAARDTVITPVLEERFRPVEFLRDFNIIDTPGTNSKVDGHQPITIRFLPSADVILVVFPVSNPWEAATWNFISMIPANQLDRLVLIVQKADQREATDLEVIRGHMSDLALKRLGRVPPIFAVSGTIGRELKKAKPFVRKTFKASGFDDLESYISFHICESPARRRGLESWRSQAAAALRSVEDRIEDQSRELNIQGRFLDTVEREIDDMRERFVARLPIHLTGVAEVFESEAVWVSKKLKRRLGVIPSLIRLFTGDRTGPAMEAVFIERLQAAVEAVAEKDGIEVVEFCREHWNPLGERVNAAMGVNLGTRQELDEMLDTARTRFIQRLGSAARQGVSVLKVRNQLEKDLRRRNRALKSFTFMTLLLTTVGASCGALAVPWAPAILCSLAGLFLTGGMLAAMATRKAITADFQQRLLDTCGSFASTLRADYEEALRIVFQDYATSLSAVRSHLAKEKQAVEPRLRRWQELFLTLKTIEQEL
jgi:GTPase Era involved in 16S rRNA processing